jgi:hypothetical protein
MRIERGLAMNKIAIVFLLLSVIPAQAKKKINPADYPLQVKITDVTSGKVATSVTTPTASQCIAPKTKSDKAFCSAYHPSSSVNSSNVYTFRVETGNKIYDVESSYRLPIGTYQGRWGTVTYGLIRKSREQTLELLFTNDKGEQVAGWFPITGEHENK